MARPDTRPLSAAQKRIWTSLRIIAVGRDVDLRTLGFAAGTPETTTGDYVRLLVRSGHCVVAKNGGRKRGNVSLYGLKLNTGPLAPYRIFDAVLDPNSGERHAIPPRAISRRQALRVPLGEATCDIQGVAA
jgi:hypothetical protein